MKKISNEFTTLAKDLGLYRSILEIGSIEKFASDLNVTSQTIRNFENGNCYNMSIMLYYFYKVDIALNNSETYVLDVLSNLENQFKEVMNIETNNEYNKHERMLFNRRLHI